MFFLLNFLQLRFSSSFFAIQKTLERRLQRVKNTLLVGGKPASEEELKELLDSLKNDVDDYSEGDLEDITMDALLNDRTPADLKWEEDRLKEMLKVLGGIHETPSKMQALLVELNRRKQANGRLRQTVLFTRFYDTLTSIRKYLSMLDSSLRVGIYAGGNRAIWYDTQRCKDCATTHEDIKAKFLSGEIDLLLCTDAAAEGLNLQTADLLINFDLGWNPMKIEQRIGRIDRIGQKHSDIEVVNMCYIGSAEQVVYGRLLERLQKANLIVGVQQISLLPVTQEEFRMLHSGELSPEQLEEQSIARLEKQKKVNASMEMSAEDLYQMYSRMSEQLRSLHYPANTSDLWKCLTESEYLKQNGSRVLADGTWTLPASIKWDAFCGTNKQDTFSADISFVSWSDTRVDHLLSVLGEITEDVPYIRIITLPERDGCSALVVSTATGAKLITAYSQIANLTVDENRPLSDQEVQACREEFLALTKDRQEQRQRLIEAERFNSEISDLHNHFLASITAAILKQLEATGYVRAMDAIKQLESNSKGIYYVDLPASQFGGKAVDLLFVTSESAGKVHTTVYGILLTCVIEEARREAANLRAKNSDKLTAELIRRLERR